MRQAVAAIGSLAARGTAGWGKSPPPPSRTRAHGLARVFAWAVLIGWIASSGAAPLFAVTFVVTSTGDGADTSPGDGVCDGDSGTAGAQCTLRAAIQSANATPGPDTIAFNLPGAGTITPATGLPTITGALTLDGTTQPGYTGTPRIEIRCALVGFFDGISVTAGSSTIRALVITQCFNGIVLTANGGNVVTGNYIGIDANGTTRRANSGSGIFVGSNTNLIGGTSVGAGNLVSGNLQYGIALSGVGATSNTIQGNRIGVNNAVTAKVPNGFGGIVIQQGAANNIAVGGTAAGSGNVISGNGYTGVWITGAATSGNIVLGNLIGTNPAGAPALGNDQGGVWLDRAPNNIIGGTAPGSANVISGNGLSGIQISGGGATGNKVQGNFIGTNAGGTAGLGNVQAGVFLYGSTSGNTVGGAIAGAPNVISGNTKNGVEIADAGTTGNIVRGNFIGTDVSGTVALGNLADGVLIRNGASNNVIGGIAAGEGNVIAHNKLNGVDVFQASVRNTIRGNRIHNNTYLGIDLGGTGTVTANDAGDGDSGPNDLMNFPEGVTATYDQGTNQTVIRGHIETPSPETVQIDLYANSTKDGLDHGEGERYVGSVTPDSNGFFCYTQSGQLPFVSGSPGSGPVVPPPWVSATATSAAGSTSEFSATKNDVELIALEVIQTVQDWTNSVTLIKDKATYVRAHIQTTDAAAAPVAVAGQLRGFRNSVELPGSPLTSLNFAGFMASANAANRTRRAILSNSLNFRLPDSWLNGTIALRLERTDGALACTEPADDGAPAGDCSNCRVNVTFLATSRFPVKFVRVKWTDAAGTTYQPASDHVSALLRRLIASFPVDDLTNVTEGEVGYSSSVVPPNLGLVNGSLENRRMLDGCFTAAGCKRLYYGVLHGPDAGGLAPWPPPTYVSSGTMSTSALGFSRHRHVHELAHNLGHDHAPYCGATADPGYPGFPFLAVINGTTVGTLGPLFNGVNAEVFGLETSMIPAPTVVHPVRNFELMTYCGSWRWPSSFTYEQLHKDLTNTFPGMAALAGARKAEVLQDYLIVRGTIDIANDAVQFLPFQRISSDSPPPQPPSGSYLLRLRDAAGGTLLEIPFQLTRSKADLPGVEPTLAVFLIPVPANPAIRSAAVLRNATVLATRSASGNAPSVQVLSPNGGENLTQDPVLLSWSGSDPDGDPLIYVVQFSADGGGSWETLALDWPAQSYSVAREFLTGTTNGLIRVIASDGFLNATDQSDAVFSVANHPPSVLMLSPSPDESFVGNQQMVFEAFARDIEDGRLSGTSLQWSSSLDGVLGSGKLLLTRADQLSEGTHTIAVTATDAASLASTTSVQIGVGRSAPAKHADVSITQSVSPDPVTVGVELDYTVTVSNDGRDTATLVTVVDNLPAGVTFLSADPSQGSCGESSGTVTCSLGSLLDDASATVVVRVIPSTPGTIENNATVSAKETDPVPANNTATEHTLVGSTGSTDLSISQADSPDPVPIGGDLLYTISVTNLGPAAAANVTMTDQIPPGSVFVSASGTGWTCAFGSPSVTCTYPVLAVGAAPSIALRVQAPSAAGMITNTASVAADDGDPVPDNDSVMESTTVTLVTISNLVPTSGPPAGGTMITIIGSHFQSGAAVRVGGADATSVVVVNGTTITATVPALAAGALYDVAVTNPDTSSGLLVKGWLADFGDVSAAYLYHNAIEKIFRAGITTGCGGGNYCPNLPITRNAMAAFILRGKHGGSYVAPDPTGDYWADVTTSTFLARWMEQFGREGITTGCGPGPGGKPNFCPTAQVTRDGMSVFLLRGKNGSTFLPPVATGNVFCDVLISTFLARWMEELKVENITQGCGAGSCGKLNFCPVGTVTRGEMAPFLVRAFGL
jgi:uncharacterized repeat protein (TIGR01451 family)/CSLREA domain-containing protein